MKSTDIDKARKLLSKKSAAEYFYKALFTPTSQAQLILTDPAGKKHEIIVNRKAMAGLVGPDLASQIDVLDDKLKTMGVEL